MIRWTTVEDPMQIELMLCRFRQLIGEVQAGKTHRNSFEPWEIEILVDLQACRLTQSEWKRILPVYQQAVERQLESAGGPPVTLSQFLAIRARKRVKIEPAPGPGAQ